MKRRGHLETKKIEIGVWLLESKLLGVVNRTCGRYKKEIGVWLLESKLLEVVNKTCGDET